jgi:hypothetical protein
VVAGERLIRRVGQARPVRTRIWRPGTAHNPTIVGDSYAIAVTKRGAQHEPQAIHVRCQLDSGTDDLTVMGVRPEAWVVAADPELAALPGDDEGVVVGHQTRLDHRPVAAWATQTQ